MTLTTQHTLRDVDPFHGVPEVVTEEHNFVAKIIEFCQNILVRLGLGLELQDLLAVPEKYGHPADDKTNTHGHADDDQNQFGIGHEKKIGCDLTGCEGPRATLHPNSRSVHSITEHLARAF